MQSQSYMLALFVEQKTKQTELVKVYIPLSPPFKLNGDGIILSLE